MDVSGVFSSCETLLTKSVFLPRELQFGVQAADNEPASNADGQHQHGDKQTQRELRRVRGLRELRGVDEITRRTSQCGSSIADFTWRQTAASSWLENFSR